MKKKTSNICKITNAHYMEYGTMIMLASFMVYITIAILMLFPVFGLGISFFAMCFLCIGLKKHTLNIISNKPSKLENVFDYYKYSLSAFCLKVSCMALSLLWSLLLIVPGIIVSLNFSMSMYVLADNPKMGAIEAMKESKKLVYGKRGFIFLVFLYMILITCVVAGIFSGIVIFYNMFITMPLWFNILVPTLLTALIFVVYILPYFEIMFANLYLTLIPKPKQKGVKSASTIEQ